MRRFVFLSIFTMHPNFTTIKLCFLDRIHILLSLAAQPMLSPGDQESCVRVHPRVENNDLLTIDKAAW